jgi:hypothetical protein
MVQAIAPALTLMLALQPGMYSIAIIIVVFTVFLVSTFHSLPCPHVPNNILVMVGC